MDRLTGSGRLRSRHRCRLLPGRSGRPSGGGDRPSYFEATLEFDPVGVLRHELGHVLGFRHEHIRRAGWQGCQPEDLDATKALTDYDAKSVMHYLCDGIGSPALELTEVDREGAQSVYGPPLGSFELVS